MTLLEMGEELLEVDCLYSNIMDVTGVLQGYLFDFPYTVEGDGVKSELESKFIRHYLMREIGQETPAIFRMFLQSRWMELLPRANLYYRIREIIRTVNLLDERDIHHEYQDKENRDEQRTVKDNDENTNRSNTEREKNLERTADSHKKNEGSGDTYTDTNKTGNTYSNKNITGSTNDKLEYGKNTTTNNIRNDVTQVLRDGYGIDFPQGNIDDGGDRHINYATDKTLDLSQEEHQITDNGSVKDSGADTHEITRNDVTIGSTGNNEHADDHMAYKAKGDNWEESTEKLSDNDTVDTESTFNRIRDMMEDILHDIGKEGKSRDYGRTGMRSLGSILADIANAYQDPEEFMIQSCNDLFMLIY